MRDIDREHRYRGRPEVRVSEILDDRVALPRELDSPRHVVPLRLAACQLDGVVGAALKAFLPIGSHQTVLPWLSAIPDGLKILALERQSQRGHQRPPSKPAEWRRHAYGISCGINCGAKCLRSDSC